MNTRKLLAAALMAAAGLSGINAADYRTVMVTDASGQSAWFELEDMPVVTLKADALELSTAHTTVSYPATGRLSFAFSEKAASESTVVETPGLTPAFRITGSAIEASGLTPGASVWLHNLSGTSLANASADADGNAALTLPSELGVYIISTSDKTTLKFLLK